MARSTLDVILNFVTKGDKKARSALESQLTTMAALGAAALAARKAWDFAKEGAQLAKFEAASRDMARSVGQDMDDIVRSLQRVSEGAIDQATAMELASRAIRLGVAETPAEFAKLSDAAIKLGAAMGRGPVDAMNDIVTGIGRMSPLILDNIGIMTNGGQVFEDYADSIGKAADELTDGEKKQALFNAAVEDSADLADVQVSSFEQLDAAIKDLTDAVKKGLVPAIEPAAELMNFFARDSEITAGIIDFALNPSMENAGQIAQDWARAQVESWNVQRITNRILQNETAPALSEHEQRMLAVRDAALAIPDRAIVDVGVAGADRALEDVSNFANGVTAMLLDEGWRWNGQRWVIDLSMRVSGGLPTLGGGSTGQGGGGGGSPYVNTGQSQAERKGGYQGPGGQHGFSMTVPPGFGGDGFPFRASSGEQVKVSNRDERSFFSNSNVNINNGTGLEAFEEILRSIQ